MSILGKLVERMRAPFVGGKKLEQMAFSEALANVSSETDWLCDVDDSPLTMRGLVSEKRTADIVNDISKRLGRVVGPRNLITATSDEGINKLMVVAYNLSAAKLADWEDALLKRFPRSLTEDNVSLDQQNAIALLQAFEFAVKYLNDLAGCMVDAVYADGSLDKHTARKLDELSNLKRMNAFVTIANLILMGPREVGKRLDSVEGIIFNNGELEQIQRGATTQYRIDPLGLASTADQFNPFLAFGYQWNLHLRKKRDMFREEVSAVRLKIMAIEEKQKEETDPALIARYAKQIQYHTNRANVLDSEIEKLER